MLGMWSTCVNTEAHDITALAWAVVITLMDFTRGASQLCWSLNVHNWFIDLCIDFFGTASDVVNILCFLVSILFVSVTFVGGCASPCSHHVFVTICGFCWIDGITSVLKDYGVKVISPMKSPKHKYAVWFLVWFIAISFYFQLSLNGNKLEGFSKVFCKIEDKHELDCLVGMHNAPPKSAKDCALNGSDFCGAPLPWSKHINSIAVNNWSCHKHRDRIMGKIYDGRWRQSGARNLYPRLSHTILLKRMHTVVTHIHTHTYYIYYMYTYRHRESHLPSFPTMPICKAKGIGVSCY